MQLQLFVLCVDHSRWQMYVLAELGTLRKAEYFYTIIACSCVHHANMSNLICALTYQMGLFTYKKSCVKVRCK